MQYRVGVVGTGLMGQRMLGMLAAHDAFTVTRLVDGDRTRAAAAVAQAPAARVDERVDTVCAADDVDIVYIATPPDSHVPIGLAAAAAGKAVFCEKPLAVDLDAAEQLVAAVEAAGVPNAIHFPFAAAAGLARIDADLQAGTAGAPLRIDIAHHFSSWPRSWHRAGPWLDGTAEGGFVREVFSHFAYLTLRVMGELEVEQSSVSIAAGANTETHVSAQLEANGVPVRFMAGAGGAAPDANEWVLYASKQSYRLRDWNQFAIGTASGWQSSPWDDSDVSGTATLDALCARMQGLASPLPELRVGLEVQRVVETIRCARDQ
ncbi:MAG: Gfo/Idh/MocA family oxidoreductase [Planctomycetota bacterium]